MQNVLIFLNSYFQVTYVKYIFVLTIFNDFERFVIIFSVLCMYKVNFVFTFLVHFDSYKDGLVEDNLITYSRPRRQILSWNR